MGLDKRGGMVGVPVLSYREAWLILRRALQAGQIEESELRMAAKCLGMMDLAYSPAKPGTIAVIPTPQPDNEEPEEQAPYARLIRFPGG